MSSISVKDAVEIIVELIRKETNFRITKLKNYGYYSFSNLCDISFEMKLLNAFHDDERITLFKVLNSYKEYLITVDDYKFSLKYESTKSLSKLVLDLEL